MSSWSFVNHLTNHLKRDREGDPKHPTLWPSEGSAVVTNEYGEQVVAGKCRRATYLRYAVAHYEFYKNFEFLEPLVQNIKSNSVPTDNYMYWIWRAGELFEDYIISLAQKTGVYIDEQIPIYAKDINLSGKIDLRIINPESHKLSIVEVKSVYGHNSNQVMGSPYERRSKVVKEPRDSNLIQIALYDWHWASNREDHENSRLLYGARDTGRYAEYGIKTEEHDGITKIFYRMQDPFVSKWVESPITIDSILKDGYSYVEQHLKAGTIPPRDFEIEYSQEKIDLMYSRGQLSKTDTAKVEKIKARELENEERVAEGKAPKQLLKPLKKGDWQCAYCKFRKVCFNENGDPKEL